MLMVSLIVPQLRLNILANLKVSGNSRVLLYFNEGNEMQEPIFVLMDLIFVVLSFVISLNLK